MKTKNFVASLLFLSFILSTKLFAVMAVGPLIVDFVPYENAYLPQTIKVFNTGDKAIYVRFKLSKLNNTKTPEKRQLFDGKNPKDFGLMLEHSKIIIPAYQTRNIKILALTKPSKEDVLYYVNVAQVNSELESIAKGNDKHLIAGLNISFAYNIRVVLRPIKPIFRVSLKRSGNKLVITNTGNTTGVIQNGRQCKDKKQKNCVDLPHNDSIMRLYNGDTKTIKLPKQWPVYFQSRAFEQSELIHSN